MRIIGCDLHARQQTLAMLDTETGEVVILTLMHEGDQVREFHAKLPRPVLVGIEATGSMHWFLNLVDELGIECRVDPATIRAAAPRKQKTDRRDAELILKPVVENRFPAIWLPTRELLDLRALVLHRHQWVRIRTRIQNALFCGVSRENTKKLIQSGQAHLHLREVYSGAWPPQTYLARSSTQRGPFFVFTTQRVVPKRSFASANSLFILPDQEAFTRFLYICAPERNSRAGLRSMPGCLSSNLRGRGQTRFFVSYYLGWG